MTLLVFVPALPMVAETPPAKTYQPGFWQPVARVDLTRPLKIKIVNNTDVQIEYDFTTTLDVPPQLVNPQDSVVIDEPTPIPAYLLINRSESAANDTNSPRYNLRFNVVVDEDNTVTINVVKVDVGTPRNTTFNLHETGAIYVY